MNSSIDDYLGPAAERFFGEGFRRVHHAIRDVHTAMGVEGVFGVQGSAALKYPEDWSTKPGKSELRPHLSTIDAFLVSVELIDLLLVQQFGLDSAGRADAWISAVDFRSGTAPLEDLRDVPVAAGVLRTVPGSGWAGGYVSTVESTVGPIKVLLTVHHSIRVLSARSVSIPCLDEVIGASADRFYGEGYKHHRHRIGALSFGEDRSATARVEVTLGDGRDYPVDLGGAYRPSVSVLDCIIAQSQITQALLYCLDDIDRAESNTLWMRRVRIEAVTPYRPLGNAFESTTRVDKTRLLRIADGVFRSTEFSGSFQGLTSRYSLAHQLPASVADRVSDSV
nr:AvrD family protein [Leifsonia shinshuensis]